MCYLNFRRVGTSPIHCHAWQFTTKDWSPVKLKRNAKLSLASAVVLIAPIVLAGAAYADYAPQPGDVVGIGGDTPQYAIDFGANGDFLGDLGFNSSNPVNRLVSFDASADANGSTGYTKSGGTWYPTDVLRAGSFPVQRNSSSGNSITALLADTSTPETINYIFSSTLPTVTQQNLAATEGFVSLHVVEIGTDDVGIATAATTNAPAGGLTPAQLLTIYTNSTATSWSTLTGGTDPSTGIIIPLLPPSSSAIYKALIAALTAANGGTAPTLGTNVVTVEQNDPTAITGLGANAANAIVPFSQARLNLWNGVSPAFGSTAQYTNPTGGYFHNPATAFPGTATASVSGISILPGWTSPITDYVIYRQSDQSLAKSFEPGGTLNWAQTLFSNPSGTPFFAKASTQALIAAAGVTPNYVDLGAAHQ